MKIGDLVKYIPEYAARYAGADMFGIIEELDEACGPPDKVWVRWLDSADLQWADPDHLEILSEA